MKESLNKIKIILKRIDGEKRNIGIVLWLLTLLAKLVIPNALSKEVYDIIEAVSASLAGIGTAHDAAKKGRLKWIMEIGTKVKLKKK